MKRKVWILNHYATAMYFNRAGRHYWFAENLLKRGYEPTIFCANVRHNSSDVIELGNSKYLKRTINKIPFLFIKTNLYKSNNLDRIKNIYSFYKNIISVARNYEKIHGKPDVIIASSVHPLTLLAGIKLSKKYNVPCISEVRDLWPESLVAYKTLRKKSFLTKLLYQGEKWIYKKSDAIIVTWEGGKQYIKDKKWEKDINLSKVHFISNGLDIETFDRNSMFNKMDDLDLSEPTTKKIIYTGAIRKVNNLSLLLDVAKVIQDKGRKDIQFLIYGSGDEKAMLMTRCKQEGINNVIFKGWIEKKYVPFILKSSYINILHNSSTSLDKYGQSQNKLFEYLAAGRIILQTYTPAYSVIDKHNAGVSMSKQSAIDIANTIIEVSSNTKSSAKMADNARRTSYLFDFKVLTDKLIEIIENVEKK